MNKKFYPFYGLFMRIIYGIWIVGAPFVLIYTCIAVAFFELPPFLLFIIIPFCVLTGCLSYYFVFRGLYIKGNTIKIMRFKSKVFDFKLIDRFEEGNLIRARGREFTCYLNIVFQNKNIDEKLIPYSVAVCKVWLNSDELCKEKIKQIVNELNTFLRRANSG